MSRLSDLERDYRRANCQWTIWGLERDNGMELSCSQWYHYNTPEEVVKGEAFQLGRQVRELRQRRRKNLISFFLLLCWGALLGYACATTSLGGNFILNVVIFGGLGLVAVLTALWCA